MFIVILMCEKYPRNPVCSGLKSHKEAETAPNSLSFPGSACSFVYHDLHVSDWYSYATATPCLLFISISLFAILFYICY
jgi:hypothetical protein